MRMKLLLAEAVFRLLITSYLLRIIPSARVSRMLLEGGPKTATPNAGVCNTRYSEEEICWALRTAARYIPASCLPQSLVGRTMLRREGYPAEIRVGVSRSSPGFQAHAWVLSGNKVVLGASSTPYAELRRQI
jgi:hypothetical protein